MEPTVGRIVHFYPEGADEPLAALVTRTHRGSLVNLTVFAPDPQMTSDVAVPQARVPFLETVTPPASCACWTWPPRDDVYGKPIRMPKLSPSGG